MADSPYHAAIAFLTKPLRFRFLNETFFSGAIARPRACVVWGGGGVLLDGGIQDAVVRSEWFRDTRRSQGGASSHGLRVSGFDCPCACGGLLFDVRSFLISPLFFFFVRCGVQDGGVQDGGDLSRMMHDARISFPIRPAARRQYSKCSPF